MDPNLMDDLERVEVVDDLLDEYWFFDNLLNEKTRVLRYCHSDPYPSSSSSSSNSVQAKNPDIVASGKKIKDHSSASRGLIRAPSLPPCIERTEVERKEISKKQMGKLTRQLSEKVSIQEPKLACMPRKELMVQAKARDSRRRSKLMTGQSSTCNLQRTQTLPCYIGREETIQDNDRDTRLSFLIREAMASSSETTTPRQQISKAVTHLSSIPRHRPPRNSEAESSSTILLKETRGQSPDRRALRKTLSSLETEEIQGFKDLGFEFDREDLCPGLQDKKQEDLVNPERLKRDYLSKAWLAKSCAPPIPTCVAKDSSGREMKAQIKFWARAVACNVRQES